MTEEPSDHLVDMINKGLVSEVVLNIESSIMFYHEIPPEKVLNLLEKKLEEVGGGDIELQLSLAEIYRKISTLKDRKEKRVKMVKDRS